MAPFIPPFGVAPANITNLLPSQTGNSGKYLQTDGLGGLSWMSVAGSGTVTTVSVATANGVSGSVANATTTPAITLTLGAITPTTVNSVTISGSSTPTLAVTGTSSISGANTGDQTITLTGAVTGSGTGSFATTIATPGTLTVASSNSTATAHTHAITSSSAPGAAASILATDSSGIIGSTGTRIVKGWFIDLTVTNNIVGSITGNAATVTTNANLTGPITSSGNATSIASQTGTGTKFVVDTSPTIATPTLSGHIVVEGITTTGATGTGNMVFASAPTITSLTVNTLLTANTELDVVGSSGTLHFTAASDGADYNIYSSNGSQTLAFYGSGGNSLSVKLLDGNLNIGAPTNNSGDALTTDGAQTETNKEISGGVLESNVFHDLLTTQNITLPASRSFIVLAGFEIAAAYSLEIPATSSLEVAAYLEPVGAPATAIVTSDETTASTSYVDLNTVGPTVTVTVGTSGIVRISISCGLYNSTNADTFASVVLSGANTQTALSNENDSARTNSTVGARTASVWLMTGLAAGSTTFKLQYRTSAGTGHGFNRRLSVEPL